MVMFQGLSSHRLMGFRLLRTPSKSEALFLGESYDDFEGGSCFNAVQSGMMGGRTIAALNSYSVFTSFVISLKNATVFVSSRKFWTDICWSQN